MSEDDGYDTDDTILNENYTFEDERMYNMRKDRKRKENPPDPPRTPPPRRYGPDPATEMLNQYGQRLFARVAETGELVPYTTNDAKNRLPMYDQDGKLLIPKKLFPGGASKSRRRSIKKRMSRKRKSKRSRRRRKPTRRYRK